MPGLWPIRERREAGHCLLSRNNLGACAGMSVSDHLPPLQGLLLSFFTNVSLLVFGCAGSPSRCGLLLAVGSEHCSGDVVRGLLRSVAPLVMAPGLESTGSIAVAPSLGCSAASGFLPDQGLNPCLLHWQAESLPLSHQGSPTRTLPACGSNLRKTLLPICLLRNQPGTYSQARHESSQSIFNTHGTTQV